MRTAAWTWAICWLCSIAIPVSRWEEGARDETSAAGPAPPPRSTRACGPLLGVRRRLLGRRRGLSGHVCGELGRVARGPRRARALALHRRRRDGVHALGPR